MVCVCATKKGGRTSRYLLFVDNVFWSLLLEECHQFFELVAFIHIVSKAKVFEVVLWSEKRVIH